MQCTTSLIHRDSIKSKNMIQIENLSFNYSRKRVLTDISLNLLPGNIYGLLGQNGVGKTTLLKIIGGLLPVKDGKCEVMGQIPFKRSPGFLEEIIFVPEDFTPPDMIVNKYVKGRGQFYPRFDFMKFAAILSEFEVDGDQKFGKLSYGQQKKAIIAFALSANVKLLLLDEPSNGLDIPSKSQLRKIIARSADEDCCIIISTHQVRDLENLIDPIIILDTNKVLLKESIANISSKLTFKFSGKTDEKALYSESTPGGYLSVAKNVTGEESAVNIEALFNTVIKNKEEIKNIFNSNLQ